jgi:sulfite reductase alpha subunit-like flavoprotein
MALHLINSLTLRKICSRAETQLAAGAQVRIPIFIKPTPHFRLPADLDAPVVMIGPGTGVAPFVGFVEHRRQLRKMLARDSQTGLYPVDEMSALTLGMCRLFLFLGSDQRPFFGFALVIS